MPLNSSDHVKSFISSPRQSFSRLREKFQFAALKAFVRTDQKKLDLEPTILQPSASDSFSPVKSEFIPDTSCVTVDNSTKTIIPKKDKLCKPILVLDLDETLIHSSLIPRRPCDFWIEVLQNKEINSREIFWVYKRPGLDRFLEEISKVYTVHVFTAGIKEYACKILDRLDPSGTLISARFYREECTEIRSQGTFAKDLTKISKDLSRVILVDNTPACFSLQPANGIPIKSWYSDLCDKQLYRLRDFLIGVASEPDFRLVLSEWHMH